jgi:hypothetical protein
MQIYFPEYFIFLGLHWNKTSFTIIVSNCNLDYSKEIKEKKNILIDYLALEQVLFGLII